MLLAVLLAVLLCFAAARVGCVRWDTSPPQNASSKCVKRPRPQPPELGRFPQILGVQSRILDVRTSSSSLHLPKTTPLTADNVGHRIDQHLLSPAQNIDKSDALVAAITAIRF